MHLAYRPRPTKSANGRRVCENEVDHSMLLSSPAGCSLPEPPVRYEWRLPERCLPARVRMRRILIRMRPCLRAPFRRCHFATGGSGGNKNKVRTNEKRD